MTRSVAIIAKDEFGARLGRGVQQNRSPVLGAVVDRFRQRVHHERDVMKSSPTGRNQWFGVLDDDLEHQVAPPSVGR